MCCSQLACRDARIFPSRYDCLPKWDQHDALWKLKQRNIDFSYILTAFLDPLMQRLPGQRPFPAAARRACITLLPAYAIDLD